jgi:hypothetical protein
MSKLLIKRSAVATKVPTTTDLDLGELGVNTYDGKVYIKKNDGTESIVEVSAVAHKADTNNPHSVNKAQVGLGSVDNTSDVDKPVSTAQQTALDGKVDDAQVQTDVPADAVFTDTTYGVATTSALGLVEIGYTENGQNYPVELSTNKMYVNVPWSDTNTTYSAASSSALGLVKLYSNTDQSVAANAVSTTASRTYGIQLNSSDQMVVNVPWSDTDTVYEHPTSDGNLHVPATSTGNNGKFLMAGSTAGSLSWGTPTDTNTTYGVATASVSGLVQIGYAESGKNYPVELSSSKMFVNVPWTDTVYTHPTGAGNNHIPSGGSTGQFLKWSSSGVAVWAADNDTVYTHPTTAGNKHIPSGGLALQILKYSSNGTAYWANETNTWRGIDDVPVDGQTAESISSNWAFDHAASSKHIPSGGTVGQILVNTGSGTAAWSAGVAPVKNRFTATASQTVFTLTSTSDGLDANTEVFVNGVLMELTDDYALTNATTITMAAPLPAGHKVMIKYST